MEQVRWRGELLNCPGRMHDNTVASGLLARDGSLIQIHHHVNTFEKDTKNIGFVLFCWLLVFGGQ
jgi:hypothetical protein